MSVSGAVIFGAGHLAGIGFSMALCIAELALEALLPEEGRRAFPEAIGVTP